MIQRIDSLDTAATWSPTNRQLPVACRNLLELLGPSGGLLEPLGASCGLGLSWDLLESYEAPNIFRLFKALSAKQNMSCSQEAADIEQLAWQN